MTSSLIAVGSNEKALLLSAQNHPEEDAMKALKERFVQLVKGEEGATATEYAVMLVLIIVVALATIIILGQKVENGFNKVAEALNNAT